MRSQTLFRPSLQSLPYLMAAALLGSTPLQAARITTPADAPVQTASFLVDAGGGGDYTTIAAALKAVPPGGATIQIKRGTYTLTDSLTVSAKTYIQGEHGVVIEAPLSTSNAVVIDGADVTLDQLEIDGRYRAQAGGGDSITRSGIIMRTGSHRLKIINCNIHDVRGFGIANAAAGDDLYVQGCRIANPAVAPDFPTGSLKGVYVAGVKRPVVKDCFVTGWSQAIGFWYGVTDGEVSGNRLVDNYGYEDDGKAIYRSAIEDYGSVTVHGRNRWINNLIDGSTSHCLEIAQGVVGSVYAFNTLRNWGSDRGLNGSAAIMIAGEAGALGNTSDIMLEGNYILGGGGSGSVGATVVTAFVKRVTFKGNRFTNFAHAPATVWLQGGSNVQFVGNIFHKCNRAIYGSAGEGRIITGNTFDGDGVTGNAIEIAPPSGGNVWLIQSNNISGYVGSGVFAEGGSQHRIIGNDIVTATGAPIRFLWGCDNNHVVNNRLVAITSGGSGAILIGSSGNIVRDNDVYDAVVGDRDVRLEAGVTSNVVQENTLANERVLDLSGSTTNRLEPNSSYSIKRTGSLKALGAQTVGATQVAIPHGLGFTPTVVNVTMTSAGNILRSATSDALNIYLTADAGARTADVFVR